MALTILDQEQKIKEFLQEINKFKGREVLFATFHPKNKLMEKGLTKVESERFINFLVSHKLMEVEIKVGRYGSRFKIPEFIDYEKVLDWRTQSIPGKTKSNAKIEVKEKPAPKVAEESKVKPKEYKLGQTVFFLIDNKLEKGRLVCMEIAKESLNKQFENLKNSDFEYTVLSDKEGKYCFEVFEFSDSIEGLFAILKSRFNKLDK